MKDLLTSEDYKFGKDLTRQYPKLALNDIYVLIYNIRSQFEYAESFHNGLKTLRQIELTEFEENLSKGTIIHNIIINTNKGSLLVTNYGGVIQKGVYKKGIYENLFKTLKKLIPKNKEYADKDNMMFKYESVNRPFELIVNAVNKTPLGPDQRRIVIGMLLAYFQIFGKGKPMTEPEHKESSNIDTWKRYLSGFVKQKLEHFHPIY